MHQGDIFEAGPTEAVYTDPRHGYTRKPIGSSMDLRTEVERRRAVAV